MANTGNEEFAISATKFVKTLEHTSDEVWRGILMREFFHHKHTMSGWKQVLASIKTRPAK